jgi:hypothetical protein
MKPNKVILATVCLLVLSVHAKDDIEHHIETNS